MTPSLPALPEAVLVDLRRERLVRPAAVAVGRARLVSGDWPPALAVADALLAGRPRQLVGLC